MPGGGGREPLVADVVQRVRAGGLSVRVTSRDGRRRGPGAASLTWVRGALGAAPAT
jgi:hypothetical protein